MTHEPFEYTNRSYHQLLREYLYPQDYEVEPDPFFFFQTECKGQLELSLFSDPLPIAVVFVR